MDVSSRLCSKGTRIGIVAAMSAALGLYFFLSLAFFPSVYLQQLAASAKSPAPFVASVQIMADNVTLGQQVKISVVAENNGDAADMQTVSVGFPNLTSSANIAILKQTFPQEPVMVSQGSIMGYNYSGTAQSVRARYAVVEAQSWPWEHGRQNSLVVATKPITEGAFVVYIKSVAVPSSGSRSHFPSSGMLDQQGEYVQVYHIRVTKT